MNFEIPGAAFAAENIPVQATAQRVHCYACMYPGRVGAAFGFHMATCPLRSENRQTTGNAIDAFEKAALANAKQKETV